MAKPFASLQRDEDPSKHSATCMAMFGRKVRYTSCVRYSWSFRFVPNEETGKVIIIVMIIMMECNWEARGWLCPDALLRW